MWKLHVTRAVVIFDGILHAVQQLAMQQLAMQQLAMQQLAIIARMKYYADLKC